MGIAFLIFGAISIGFAIYCILTTKADNQNTNGYDE